MTEIKCEFGCECDTPSTFLPQDAMLDQEDLNRLIKEKIFRAQRYSALLDRIGGQFETD